MANAEPEGPMTRQLMKKHGLFALPPGPGWFLEALKPRQYRQPKAPAEQVIKQIRRVTRREYTSVYDWEEERSGPRS